MNIWTPVEAGKFLKMSEENVRNLMRQGIIPATKVGGLAEIVKDGENGFLVEPKKPEQIAEKILLLLKDEKLRKRISKNNKEKKEYSWENVIDRLEEIYLKAINVSKRKTGGKL